jgi:hypothetical protein
MHGQTPLSRDLMHTTPEEAASETSPGPTALATSVAPSGRDAVVLLGQPSMPLSLHEALVKRTSAGWALASSSDSPGWTSVRGETGVLTAWDVVDTHLAVARFTLNERLLQAPIALGVYLLAVWDTSEQDLRRLVLVGLD